MHHGASLLAALGAVVSAVSCHGGSQAVCMADKDCGEGLICRDQVCGPTSTATAIDAGNNPFDAASCVPDSMACGSPSDCCGTYCNSGTCASTASPTCIDVYQMCSVGDTCCNDLTCTNGTCR